MNFSAGARAKDLGPLNHLAVFSKYLGFSICSKIK